jgi:hypothetical protein
MLISSEALKQDIDKLNHEQLQQVADFIAFLKFRDKRHRHILNSNQLVTLATEFAEEDRALAEAGINDYAELLYLEDQL